MRTMSWVQGVGLLAVCLVVTGCKPLTVPDVVGMAQGVAADNINGANLVLGTATLEYSATVPAGFVISQSPAAGTRASAGDVVALIVSEGPPTVPVPNVVGLEQLAAMAAINSGGLAVGIVTQQHSDTVTPGCVISQNPAAQAGVLVNAGTTVSLVVSSTTETVMLPSDVPLEMLWIPAGTFTMGSPDTDLERALSEIPQHAVSIASGFWMGKYELTKRQWQAAMGTTPWNGQANVLADPDSPAVYVSWNDAQIFLTGINNYTGKTFRLPSEAQWEYACRGGTTTPFWWGRDERAATVEVNAWYYYNCLTDTYAHVVGRKTANTFGLYDMTGNVSEWCQDWWHENYLGAPTDGGAWESPATKWRVRRGGDWSRGSAVCRSADRELISPDVSDPGGGFRVVRIP